MQYLSFQAKVASFGVISEFCIEEAEVLTIYKYSGSTPNSYLRHLKLELVGTVAI